MPAFNLIIKITPFAVAKGECREVLTFYHKCLGGELTLQKVGESPMAAQMTSEEAANILHGSLAKNGSTIIMGSDRMGARLNPVIRLPHSD